MGIDTKEKTVLNPSVGADRGQPIHTTELSIPDCGPDYNDAFERLIRKIAEMNDPANLPTVTMQELYETVYQAKPRKSILQKCDEDAKIEKWESRN